MIWSIARAELGKYAAMDEQLFKIGVLGIAAYVAGFIFAFFRLPSLLGMMLMGILFRNVGYLVVTGNYRHGTRAVRQIALVILLIRAGLEVHLKALRRFWLCLLKVTTIPVAVEILTMSILSYFFLNMPLIWSFVLGSLLAAVSMAVVIPCLLRLKQEGNYGHSKGISTLVLAASSVIDVGCVTIFGVLLSIAFSTGDTTRQIIGGPVCVAVGLTFGVTLGIFMTFVPDESDRHVTTIRTSLIAIACLFMMLGSAAIGFEGAGPLGCFVIPIAASNAWPSKDKIFVEETFAFLWHFFQPLLFGLIGASINFTEIEAKIVAPGIGALAGSLLVRSVVCFATLYGHNLNWKEKLFLSITWCPKATIQAALGPVALDRARDLNLSEDIVEHAETLLVLAVLSVLITAPLFDFLIIFLGPRLLDKEESMIEETKSDSIITQIPTAMDFFV